MNEDYEQESLYDYLDDENSIYDESIEESNTEKFSGTCHKCLNTNFIVEERNGVIGVLYTTDQNDSLGKPIRKLQVCGHGLKLNY